MWKPEAYRWKVDATPGMAAPKTGPARANPGERATHRGTSGATGGKRTTNPPKAAAKSGTAPATRGKASAVLLATRGDTSGAVAKLLLNAAPIQVDIREVPPIIVDARLRA